MFTFRVFVDDKRLGDSLKALQGIVLSIEPPQVVTNAELKPNGQLVQKTNGSLIEMVKHEIEQGGKPYTTRDEIEKLTTKAGGKRSSSYYIIKRLKVDGFIGIIPGRHNTYRVLGREEAALANKHAKVAAQREVKRKSKKRSTYLPEGSFSEALEAHLNKTYQSLDTVTSKAIKAYAIKLGLANSSYTNGIRNLREKGILKPTSEPGVWNFIRKEEIVTTQ